MNRGLVSAAVITVACLAASGPARLGAQQPTFRVRTDVVSVPASVMKGREPMRGLVAADFEVTDNGVSQQVEAVSLERVPIDVTLVITGYRKSAAADHIRGLISAHDTRELLTPADRLRIVEIGDDVRGALVGADFTVPTDHADAQYIPGIALVDGLFYAIAWPVDADRRHLVVAFTDGWDTWSTLELDMLPRLAAHSDAVLHAVLWDTPDSAGPDRAGSVGPGTPPPMPDFWRREWEAGYHTVDAAVQRTGGTLQTTKNAAEALASIIDDFRSSYVLRYTPRNVALKGWHELRVKVTRPGSFAVRARKGYEGG